MASVAQAPTSNQSMPALQTIAVQSSFIAALEYDQQNLTLTTHLKSGAIYQHKFCLPMDWELLKTAKNPSKHWAQNIKGKKASVRIKVAKSPTAGIKTGRRQ